MESRVQEPLGELEFAWWAAAGETVRVLRRVDLWGQTTCEVLVPSAGRLARVPAHELAPVAARPWRAEEVIWRVAAARAVRAMATGQPVAIRRGRLVPLPHQLGVLDRALASDPVRLLLADEVGLGKTIEAGLMDQRADRPLR
jgi:hypothetical protein